ncbi:MAG: GatB/YqeY domain-containing protein [Bacteroidota bacterium]|nr:GatB/YqeY domain-containing protein [Bacteroidota bacterium]
MNLFDKINQDIKTAMKAKEADKLMALRDIKSALLLLKTSGKGEITEELEVQTLQKMVKQRKESAAIYKDEGRDELFEKEMSEAAIIQEYLPEQMSEEEIKTVVKDIIDRVGAEGMKDMGKVMGTVTQKLGGKAEGSIIASVVKGFLMN